MLEIIHVIVLYSAANKGSDQSLEQLVEHQKKTSHKYTTM